MFFVVRHRGIYRVSRRLVNLYPKSMCFEICGGEGQALLVRKKERHTNPITCHRDTYWLKNEAEITGFLST